MKHLCSHYFLFFVFILYGARFLANFFAPYEVRHQILDEEIGKLQGLFNPQNIQNVTSGEVNNKYLPKVEAKDEHKIFLNNALHIRSPHNNRI